VIYHGKRRRWTNDLEMIKIDETNRRYKQRLRDKGYEVK